MILDQRYETEELLYHRFLESDSDSKNRPGDAMSVRDFGVNWYFLKRVFDWGYIQSKLALEGKNEIERLRWDRNERQGSKTNSGADVYGRSEGDAEEDEEDENDEDSEQDIGGAWYGEAQTVLMEFVLSLSRRSGPPQRAEKRLTAIPRPVHDEAKGFLRHVLSH
jgi:hypothetical protein